MHIEYNRIVEFMEKYQILCFSVFIITAIVISNFFLSGIVINDELQTNLLRKNGLLNVLIESINTELKQGRAARIIAGALHTFPAMSTSYMVNRTLQVIAIFATSIMFALTINKCLQDKFLALFVGVLSIVALPITFSMTPPDSNVGHVVIPVFLCLLSLYLHCIFIENRNRKIHILSLIIFLISISCYEFMVSTFLLHAILCMQKKNQQIFSKDLFKDIRGYLFLAIAYCVVYFCARHIFPSQYTGNQLGFDYIFPTMFEVIKTSLPGCYLLSKKYLYLLNLYGYDFFQFHNYKLNFISLKTFLCFFCMYFILYICLKKAKYTVKNFMTMENLLWLIQIVLLVLPVALAKMYQEIALSGEMIIHPVNYPIFLIVCLGIGVFIWSIIHHYVNNILSITLLAIILSGIISGIQGMNAVFAEQEARNYSRLQTIERMLLSETFLDNFADKRIYAPNLYKTMDGLGFIEWHWTAYMHMNGYSKGSINTVKGQDDAMIFDEGNNVFTVVSKNKIIIFSLKPLQSHLAIHTDEESAMIISTEKQHEENSLSVVEYDFDR